MKDKLIRELNKCIAYFLFLLIRKKERKRNNYWIFGGSLGRVYSDNSASLHKYVVENYSNILAYWIINRNSPDVDKVKKISEGRVLYRNSVKANLYALLANVHIVSHGKVDISSYRKNVFSNVFKVHLGHGVQGLKKMKAHPKLMKTFDTDYDLIAANSNYEKRIKEDWVKDSNKVEVFGMPRYDDLIEKANKNQSATKEILYMPTWRDWLVDNSNLSKTIYYNKIVELLENEHLNQILQKENIKFKVFLHINMRNQIDNFSTINNDNIIILSSDINIQNEIAKSNLLITDYSSVCWDFLYLDKPVIFYQFDLDDYFNYRGSYLDLQEGLFAPIVYNVNEVICYIEKYLKEYKADSNVKKWKNKMFKYQDNNNRSRALEKIVKKLYEK